MILARKRIVLTGGSGGLGRSVAAALCREGAEITTMSRAGIADGTSPARHAAIDLSTAAGIAEACDFVAREEPDILVNLAGVQYFGPAERQSFDDMHRSYMVNLVAPAALCSACLPAMKRRNSGQIANIGSIFGSIAFAHFAAYSSAKAGLRALSEALRRELADTKIAVTYVAPRAVRTAMLTADIEKYATISGMNIDPPETVATAIVTAIKQRRKDVYIGFPERFFVRLNALLPRLVDTAVADTDRKASRLFAAQA
jgi:short-subunit dehydrogenase